jgi:alkylation response protein AidB-like acyl-CoA dehydrogenase
MDVRLSPEQHALRDTVAHVVDRLGPKTVADLADNERGAKLDAAVVAAGWRELRTANDDGSPWSSAVEVAIVAEELARGAADTPFLGPTLAAELRRLARVGPARDQPALGGDSERSQPRETIAFGGFAIDATGATRAFVVDDPARPGIVELTYEPVTVDLTRPSIAVATNAVGPFEGGLSRDDVQRWTALGLAVTSADLVGVMRGAVQLATDYAIDRKQYGAPIGSYQAVQHMLADALVAMEGSRSATLHAAWAVDVLAPPDALAAAALAKAYCARAARTVCETAIQVHGGIGNTWECMAHVFLRRALVSIDVLGGVGTNLERVLLHHHLGGHDGLR